MTATKEHDVYVVQLPKTPVNPSDKYLVVTDREYVRVHLKEQDAFTDPITHDDWHSAAKDRDRLNRKPQENPPAWTPSISTLSSKTSQPSSTTTTQTPESTPPAPEPAAP